MVSSVITCEAKAEENMSTTTRQGSGNNVRKDFKELRVKEAQDRLTAWSILGPERQLKALDERPGQSLKQRARLEALIKNKGKKVAPTPASTLVIAKEVATDLNLTSKVKAKDRRAEQQARSRSER